MSRDLATQRQVDAANPAHNTWLSANAGSGKTRVLTDRVARLLLAKVNPQNILCLTYTKAAASEMQNRLFKRLGEWAMLSDEKLQAQLAQLGIEDQPNLAAARRLFASAIEAPGGLKIQTIHAFCASILRRFPTEAGVSPNFQEMDDRSGKLLREEVLDTMAEGAARPLVEAVARHVSGQDFTAFLDDVISHQHGFDEALDMDALRMRMGLPPESAGYDPVAELFTAQTAQLIQRIIPILHPFGGNMEKMAGRLAAVSTEQPGPADFTALRSAFLTQAGTILRNHPTAAARKELGPLADQMDELGQNIFAAEQARRALVAVERTAALHAFAHPFLRAYREAKSARGWLDFDDLIHLTARLLNQSSVAQWVLYRLDGGIDHILVDEAQDTAPDQWQVIDALAREFTSGEGSHSGRDWSIFVVGDPKQSIYSFQGADPDEFQRMKERFNARLSAVQRPLAQRPLSHSFRSSPVVLSTVDRTLAEAKGLGHEPPDHVAFRDTLPGRVDLWPMQLPSEAEEPRPWDDPVDVPSPGDHNMELARHVAAQIETLLKDGSVPGDDGTFRPVRAGDILVLVRRRSTLFHHIIRECKARSLPIAGADVLRIGGEMAVKDIRATLEFLATPEDDLSLAACLRSPLFGWSEDDLYRLAVDRPGYLWQALRTGDYADTLSVLQDLRDQADFLRPYDLIDRLLTRHDGRRRLIGRLGSEAEDGIDAMLSQALAYEQVQVPSLTGFLTWLDAADVTIKRQQDSEPSDIRVMTVHGSKGLEAPIVILPDTGKWQSRERGALVEMADGVAWCPSKPDMPEVLDEARSQAREKDAEERIRLLYVAMTRAKTWLIVAGAGDPGKKPEDTWHGMVEAGLSSLAAAECDFPTGQGLRLEAGVWPETPATAADNMVESPVSALPPWANSPAAKPIDAPKPLLPSNLPGAKIMPGAAEGQEAEAAKRRGRQLHLLLEMLPGQPPSDWPALAGKILSRGEDAADENELADLLDEALPILSDPGLAHLFGPNTFAELPISAPVTHPDHSRMHGTIDRLIVTETKVTAVDFKSNQAIPTRPEDIPLGILRQLGAYEAALELLYPTRDIASAVLWTRHAKVMELPPGLALRAFARLDGDPQAT